MTTPPGPTVPTVPPGPPAPPATLVAAFARAVAAHPTRDALVDARHGATSFAELDRQSDAFAARLQTRGLTKGDRVLVAAPVSAALYIILAGLWKAGLVAVFPEPAMGLKGLFHAIRATRPKAFAAAGPYRALSLLPPLWGLTRLAPGGTGRPAPTPLSAEDPALISFTSGSSGTPKGISRSHGFLMAQNAAVAPLLSSEGTVRPVRDLVGFPVFVLVNLAAGRPSVLPNWRLTRQDRANGRAIRDWIARSGATRALLPPSICEHLTEVGLPEGLTDIFTGGGPVFPDTMRRLLAARPGLRLTAVYGSTEAEPIAEIACHDLAPDDWAEMEAGGGLLAGRPVPGLALRLVDGEIQVAGPHVNPGYLDPRHDAANKIRDGDRIWHRTGDAGRLDARGRLWLLGRWRPEAASPMPLQIETAARTWPGVRRAALLRDHTPPVLAIEGDPSGRASWQTRAKALGIARVVSVRHIPLDRRHASKTDEKRLIRMIDAK